MRTNCKKCAVVLTPKNTYEAMKYNVYCRTCGHEQSKANHNTPTGRIHYSIKLARNNTKRRNEKKQTKADKRDTIKTPAYKFNIDFEQVKNQLVKQEYRCAESNIVMDFKDGIRCMSLHRPDSVNGSYVPGEVVIVCRGINDMYGTSTQAEMDQYKQAIVQQPDPPFNGIGKFDMPMISKKFKEMTQREKNGQRIERLFDDKNVLVDIINEHNGRSSYSNLPVDWQTYSVFQGSFDRIDSEKGYDKDNMQLLAWPENRMKLDRLESEARPFFDECVKSWRGEGVDDNESLIEDWEVGLEKRSRVEVMQDKLKNATEWLRDKVPISEVARRCGYAHAESFGHVFTNVYGISPRNYLSNQDSDFINATLDRVEEFLGQKPLKSIAEVFKLCGYATNNSFTRSFKTKYGMTPTEWRYVNCGEQYKPPPRTSHKLDRAKDLLDKGLSLEEVANQCGYAQADSFGQAFRNKYGIGPRDYKSQGECSNYTPSPSLENVEELLLHTPQKSINEIFKLCGYKTTSAFSKAFKTKYETTPSTWQKKNNSYSHSM